MSAQQVNTVVNPDFREDTSALGLTSRPTLNTTGRGSSSSPLVGRVHVLPVWFVPGYTCFLPPSDRLTICQACTPPLAQCQLRKVAAPPRPLRGQRLGERMDGW